MGLFHFAMGKYAREPENTTKSCKARGNGLRCHFKNTREAAMALKNLTLARAKRYLNAVLDHKECIPLRRFCGSTGRTAQTKNHNHAGPGRWPTKSCKYLLDLLNNAESNAELKGLDVNALAITHIQVNRAPKMRRRTYRAHGRIGAYMCSPSHIEMILTEKERTIRRGGQEETVERAVKKISKKKLARERLKAGPRSFGE